TTGGNASFRATDGDLELAEDLSVAGDLALATVGSGDLVLPELGLSHAGDIVIDVDNLISNGTPLSLAAASADITLRDGASTQIWNPSFDQLILNIAGGGDLQLVDADDLTVASVVTNGNASFSSTDADLTVGSIDVAGDLSLIADGSGNVVIDDNGLVHDGNLIIEADNLLDSDSDVILGAAQATVTLRDGSLPSSWATSFDQLVLDIAGTGDFALVDSDGL